MWADFRSFNRGGNFNNTANGFASFNGNNDRSNSNENIGFRSALHTCQMLQAYGPAPGTDVGKGNRLLGRYRPEVYWKKNVKASAPFTLN